MHEVSIIPVSVGIQYIYISQNTSVHGLYKNKYQDISTSIIQYVGNKS